MRPRGFTLIEALMASAMFLLILAAAVEFLAQGGRRFRRVEDRSESRLEAMAALQKVREDLREAGGGLVEAVRLGILEPVSMSDGGTRLTVVSSSESRRLSSDVTAGSVVVILAGRAGLPAGRSVSLVDGGHGELRTIAGASGTRIVLDAPLESDYGAAGTVLSLLEEVEYSLGPGGVLRRKANRASAQPLLEGVREFLAGAAGPLRADLVLERAPEARLGVSIVPGNLRLAAAPSF